MTLNLANPVETDDRLPSHVDVAIMGGGIIGVAAAYYLARAGKKVVVVEKGLIAAEQSSRNWGYCRQAGRSIPEVPLAMHSLRLWDAFEHEFPYPTGFKRSGVLVVTTEAGELASWESWLQKTQSLDMQASILTPAQVREKIPYSTAPYIAGIYSPLDGLAEPTMAAPSIAKAARDLGVSFVQNCAARGMETSGGRVSALITERGAIATDAILCAGGAWSGMFCAHHGIPLPQAGVFASACRTSAVSGVLAGTGAASCEGFSIRSRVDGGYTLATRGAGRVEITPAGLRHARSFFPLFVKRRKALTLGLGRSFFEGPESMQRWKDDQISPFEKIRILDPKPDMVLLNKAFDEFKHAYPVMRDARIEQAWGGLIDSTPDSVPIISPVDAVPGFFLATGFSGHGFAIGPASGHLAAELILGKPMPTVDPTPFRYQRFFGGEKTHQTSRWL